MPPFSAVSINLVKSKEDEIGTFPYFKTKSDISDTSFKDLDASSSESIFKLIVLDLPISVLEKEETSSRTLLISKVPYISSISIMITQSYFTVY